jgi:glycerol-3-phosphate acyltransferase PlsY
MIISALLLAFLVGSVPTGYLIARSRGIDLRKTGSGNTGATNAGRVLGKHAGIVTLVIDLIKGIIGIELGLLFLNNFVVTIGYDPSPLLGFAAICGHCFSPWLGFKGGKGVATAGGVFLFLASLQALCAILVFALMFRISRIVSLSSIVAAAIIPIMLALSSAPQVLKFASFLSSALIIYRHKDNIARLLAGTEQKFIAKSS